MTTTPITVYTKPACPQCDLTKKKLDSLNIDYEIADLTDPQNLEAAKSLGYASAPVVIVGDEGWAGFRPDLIDELADRISTGEDA